MKIPFEWCKFCRGSGFVNRYVWNSFLQKHVLIIKNHGLSYLPCICMIREKDGEWFLI